MYDPNLEAKNGSMGRWSGVIFRNLAAISLDAYTGEKWNVQHKDVRITQMCSDGPYVPGDTRMVFDGLAGREEWLGVREQRGFVCGRQGDLGGHFWTDSIKRQMNKYSPIIIQTGRKADYQTFEAFRAAILDVVVKGRAVSYKAPIPRNWNFSP